MLSQLYGPFVYRGSDRVAEHETLAKLDRVAQDLSLDAETIAIARDLFLAELPVADRSKTTLLATSCYAASLITGNECSQTAVAEAFDVSRIAIQQRWKTVLTNAGFEPPRW